MTTPLYNVTGIGNAIVDILAFVEDAFLERHTLSKGNEVLIDEQVAAMLYEAMPPATEVSGGSAANTIAGLASFGGKAAYIGKVKKDQLGAIFSHDITSLGIHYPTPAATQGKATGQCFVVVTPDAERTMCAYLGASDALTPEDMDEVTLAASAITYLEGYLLYQPHLKPALAKATSIAHNYGRQVALSLSDSLCVMHNRAEFMQLIEKQVDIVFANEAEITALFETDDFEQAARLIGGKCQIAALTRGEKGSVIVKGSEQHIIPAASARQVIDTTGAGDLYASGVLYGLTHGLSLPECGRLGSLAAAEIISHLGARPEMALKELL